MSKVYTHDRAAQIVELFENVLDENGIVISSPEDDEKEEDNTAALYGSVYSNLLDKTEDILIEMMEDSGVKDYIPNVFSGKW